MVENNSTASVAPVKRCEIKRYGYTLVAVFNTDEVECRCSYEPSTSGGPPLAEADLNKHLAELKVTEGIVTESVAELLRAAAAKEVVSGLLLAQGKPMVSGEDGHLVMGVVDDLAEPAADGEDDGTVDFKRVQAFLNVEDGDLIATIVPPGAGEAGITVSGKVIPPQAGEPFGLVLGQNVRLSEDGTSIYAQSVGRVCLVDGVISVEDIYEVEGDVGFKVGNISFKGFVEIKGDVLDGFFVNATKGIKIHGNIGVCTIESKGDISFCGMNGQGAGVIRCGGSISANFIYDSTIECIGNITIATEIRHCEIKCLGAVSVSKGGMTGGECFALAGVECATLGSVTSLRTRVVAGAHYGDLEELNTLFHELKQLVAEFSAAQKENADLKEFARRRAELTERTHEVRSRVYEQCNQKINVAKVLYEGVTVTLGNVSDTTREERKGPFSIIENTIEGGLRFLGMTALTVKAEAIEQTFIQQHLLDLQKSRANLSGDCL